MQRRPAGQDDGAFDEVFQFAHITGPMIARESFHLVRGNGFNAAVHAASMLLGEVADK